MANLFEVRNISKRMGNFHLRNISLSVNCHEIIGIVGKNGAGKTTFLRSIIGLYTNYTGELFLNGLPFKNNSMIHKQQFAFLPESTALPGYLSMQDLGKVYKRFYRGFSTEYYQYLLEKFEFSTTKLIKDLSTGNRKKLGIAMVLSSGAKIIILDEPTSNIDPISRDLIIQELLKFKTNNEVAVIFSSHILYDVRKVAQKILVLNNGKQQCFQEVPQDEEIEVFENKTLQLMR